MTTAIQLDGLSKTFGRGKRRLEAVRDVTLEVPAGQVYGFLGPNGAGKTTTIRMLLALIRPTQGAMQVFGKAPGDSDVLRQVGSLVESPSFYPYLTGRGNLEVLARTANQVDRARIDALLEQVNLGARGRQKVAKYSLGMRQRLAMAAALLNDPPLLIFDEPTNGLDPQGIHEMRQFIRYLVDVQGKTVFLSSHLLNEVEQVCDRVAIIHRGALLREGNVEALLAETIRVRVQAEPPDQALIAIGERWKAVQEGDNILVEARRADIPEIAAKLTARNIAVYHLSEDKLSLEAYFLAVTRGETV
jgi:ABC-2 type transport system ATP-binding protein